MAVNGEQSYYQQYLEPYFKPVQQETFSVIEKLYKLRNDPDVFMKVGQIAFATLQLIMDRVPSTANLSKLSFALNTVNMHYFYSFLKMPRQIFTPVDSTAINENKVLKSLTDVLTAELDGQNIDEEKIKEIAQSTLEGQLKSMADINIAYEDTEKFKELLQQRVREFTFAGVDLTEVSLTNLEVTLRRTSLMDRVVTTLFNICDIGTVGLFLQIWNLLDTAKWAARIGKIPGFQWVNNCSLDAFVSGACSLAYGLKCVESARKLHDEKLTPQERRNARWEAVNAAAEFVFNGTYFLNSTKSMQIPGTVISVFAIIAKSIGILNIVTRPDHVYFQKAEHAPAAA